MPIPIKNHLKNIFNYNFYQFKFFKVGGAISTKYDSREAFLVIERSNFLENIADFGGALGFEHIHGTVEFTTCLFTKNQGRFANEGKYTLHNVGSGGVLALNGKSNSIVFSAYNMFEKNEAEYSGLSFII
jgi:hypothetical protein